MVDEYKEGRIPRSVRHLTPLRFGKRRRLSSLDLGRADSSIDRSIAAGDMNTSLFCTNPNQQNKIQEKKTIKTHESYLNQRHTWKRIITYTTKTNK